MPVVKFEPISSGWVVQAQPARRQSTRASKVLLLEGGQWLRFPGLGRLWVAENVFAQQEFIVDKCFAFTLLLLLRRGMLWLLLVWRLLLTKLVDHFWRFFDFWRLSFAPSLQIMFFTFLFLWNFCKIAIDLKIGRFQVFNVSLGSFWANYFSQNLLVRRIWKDKS